MILGEINIVIKGFKDYSTITNFIMKLSEVLTEYKDLDFTACEVKILVPPVLWEGLTGRKSKKYGVSLRVHISNVMEPGVKYSLKDIVDLLKAKDIKAPKSSVASALSRMVKKGFIKVVDGYYIK